jgi:hypothetical protein
MRYKFLTIVAFLLCNFAKAQHSSSAATVKSKIDSVRKFVHTGPSSDILPAEFNAPALKNEYYCDSTNYNGHVLVFTFRDNHTLIYEIFYKPYDWARINFRIGSYRLSGDTIYMTYKQLLKGKPDQIYVSPIQLVSWIPPAPPKYLLLSKGRLFDPLNKRSFNMLTDKLQFDLTSDK